MPVALEVLKHALTCTRNILRSPWRCRTGAESQFSPHRTYVLEGTFGFQVGEETVEGSAGAFVFAPKGAEHAFWNQGPSPARMLLMMSPPHFWRYLKELAEGLAAAREDAEAAMELRRMLSEKYDIEVVGPPRQATS